MGEHDRRAATDDSAAADGDRPEVLLVFGTRPEAIKMAPVYHRLRQSCSVQTCLTAQHRQMLDQVMDLFAMDADYDLDIMSPDQSLTQVTTRVLAGLEHCLQTVRPDYVFVHGDTTTTFAAALAAFYRQIPVCHVEAGLRTGKMYSPYPEEMNRRLAGALTSYHFAPTARSRENLMHEGVSADRIYVTGNTAIDALQMAVRKLRPGEAEPAFRDVSRKILVTAHRRENFGAGMERICRAIRGIVDAGDDTHVIIPVHYNPNVRSTVTAALGDCDAVTLTDPLDYRDFVQLLTDADLIITDSGGVQEEAPSLGKPVLVMRESTERPEAVEAGTVLLVGTDTERIVSEALALLTDRARYETMARAINPYGDGKAADRIGTFFEYVAGRRERDAVPEPFGGIDC